MIHYDPKSETSCSPGYQAARKLHAEDICIGDFVAISDVTYEYASFVWPCIDSFEVKKNELVRINYLAHEEFDLYQVKSICLPFIHTVDSKKQNRVFDLRKTNLFRLSEDFALSFKTALKKSAKRAKAKSGKKKSRKSKRK